MDNLWVVMVSRQIADAIRKDLESGLFTKATNSTNLLKSFQQNISNICQRSGGHVHTSLPEWVVLQCPVSVAEQIPSMIDDFNTQIGYSIACGIGMNFEEATKAAQKSEDTGHIELYQEQIQKDEQKLPPNLFDYENQNVANTDKTKIEPQQYASAPDFQTSIKMAQINVQNMVEQLGGNAMQEMQQQMAQQQQQQQQQAMKAQQKPRDLTEALHGQQIENRNPYSSAPQSKEKDQAQQAKQQPEQESKDQEVEKDEIDDSKNDEVQQKLGGALLHIKEQIPQLMDLSERNPTAFKQTMNLIQKLLNLTKQTKSKVTKSEMEETVEDLNKRLKALPIGTLRNRRKKVLINGKPVWRSVASGMVQDLTGEPISVKSSNLAAQQGKQAGEK